MEFRFRTMLILAAALGLFRAGAAANGASPAAPPKGGVWSLAGAMPEPRQEAGIGALGNMIYIIGGYGADTLPNTLVQVYDPAANKWKQAAPIPEAMHHQGVASADGKIYVVGGFTGSFAKRVPVNSVWQYDPASDRWEKRAPLPLGRHAIGAAVVAGRIYLPGGSIVQGGRAPGTTAIVDAFEPN
jgi:N-acetylneuraminic acid mutarotase